MDEVSTGEATLEQEATQADGAQAQPRRRPARRQAKETSEAALPADGEQPTKKRAPRKRAPKRASAASDQLEAADEALALDATATDTPQAAVTPEPVGVAPAQDSEQPEAGPDDVVPTEAVKKPKRSRKQKKDSARADAAAESTDVAAATVEAAQEGTTLVGAEQHQPPEGTAHDGATSPVFSPASMLFQAPDLSMAIPTKPQREDVQNSEESEDSESNRSKRSRSRRRRGELSEPDEASAEETTSIRRRRRRRGDSDLELTGGGEDDPPNTVTRVRAPRLSADTGSDRVASIKGSTRLEAKRQRRRDSRDSNPRRQIITEAEFLARRESVDRVMVVRQRDDRIQIGVLEDGVLAEHFVSRTQQDSLIGNVYLGKVQNVLPSMEAAFVDIGRGRNAVLYAGEVDWDGANLNGQPRKIENALKSGDTVLVQVSKDPVGQKGARLTSQISLPGRYLVYVPGGSMTGISRKLPDVERNRLKKILRDHLPENAGVIVRTAAEGASEDELRNDINRLQAQWEGIQNQATSTKTLAPEMLYGEPDLTIKVVRDVFNEDFSQQVISGEQAWDTVEAYVTYVAPDLLDRLVKWTSDEDIFAHYRITEQINKALERKVFLPSGGSLVIDRTEAMTVVDVNTGKFTGSGGNLEETVTKNNLEAAGEVVRQLRLRDIGGIIVIDFIDMVLESNRDLVLRRLVECLGRDRTKHQVAEVTSLGLVQMTRKRMGTGLLEVFGEQCETCAGRGVVTHDEPVEHRKHGNSDFLRESRHDHNKAATRQDSSGDGQRSTRNERRKNRHKNHEGDAASATATPEDDRVQRAETTRAALATIAAAAMAAHGNGESAQELPEQPGELKQAGQPAQRVEAGSETATTPIQTSSEDGDVATVTFGDEKVSLPRGRKRRRGSSAAQSPVQEPAQAVMSLDSLSTVFDNLGEETETATPTAPAQPASRRGGRRRVAGSAQGSADVSVVNSTQASQGTVVTSASASAKRRGDSEATDQSSMILGVGVPASEL